MSQAASDIAVRPGVPADAATLTLYNLRLADESEGKRLDPIVVSAGVRAALAAPELARYFVAERGGQIVGSCMVTTEWSDWRNGHIWWLQSVYVSKDHRRTGVFRALLAQVETAAHDQQAVGLRLYVERENEIAIKAYQAFGMADASYDVMEKSLR